MEEEKEADEMNEAELANELLEVEANTAPTLNRITARVHELLILKPSTRSSDAILQLEYLRRYSGVFVYNASTKLIEFRNRKGLSYEEYELAFMVFEIIRRCRQKLQENAFERIFKDEMNGTHLATQEDHLICPSDRVAARRVIREKKVRGWARES